MVLCRTFFYQATEELGAHCFRDRKEAIAWISKHFISTSQGTASSPKRSPVRRSARINDGVQPFVGAPGIHGACKGGRADDVELPCNLDLLRWAADPPKPQMMEWAMAAAAQLTEHVEHALAHGYQTNSRNNHLPDLCQLLTELSNPQVRRTERGNVLKF